MGSSVEDASNRPKRLLACSIPDLQFNNLLIDCENEWTELHTNSDLMLYLELIVHDPSQQTTLAHTYT